MIDIGINALRDDDGSVRLVGDVDTASVEPIAQGGVAGSGWRRADPRYVAVAQYDRRRLATGRHGAVRAPSSRTDRLTRDVGVHHPAELGARSGW